MQRRERGRLETNLARAPLWESGARPDPAPFDGRSLLGPFACTTRLGPLDLKVLAYVIDRFCWPPPESDSDPAKFSIYDLVAAIYGREPSGRDRQQLRAALVRLFRVEVHLVGFDASTGRRDANVTTRGRLLQEIVDEYRKLGPEPDPREVGALRGSTFKVYLGRWLAQQARAGYVTYLDFRIMRRLSGLSERLWVYLEAENWGRPAREGRVTRWVALGPDMYEVLGMHYARGCDARKALRRAGERIVRADARYDAVTVGERAGGRGGSWILRATRITDAERRKVRDAIFESLSRTA